MFQSIFKFLASLKLALMLIAGIIIASIVGTVLESSYTAELARNIVYGNIWFDCWLILLGVNLFCVAAIRYPWKPHQTGFVITHAGIITLLIGSMIDRHWGIEGFLELHKGAAPTDVMELHSQQFGVTVDGVDGTTLTKLNLNAGPHFTAKSPAPDVKVEILNAGTLRPYDEVQPAESGPVALQIALTGPQMGRQEMTLLLGDNKNLGPATISFIPGMPPPVAEKPANDNMVPRRDSCYVFAKHPDNPMVKSIGEPTGATAKLIMDNPAEPVLKLSLFEKDYTFSLIGNVIKTLPLDGQPDWKLRILGYFPNYARTDGGGEISINDKPENPTIHFELIGPLVKATENKPKASPHGDGDAEPDMPVAQGGNRLTLYQGEDGKLRYFWKSRVKGEFSGVIDGHKPVPLYYPPDSQFAVEQVIPHATTHVVWKPVGNHADMRMQSESETLYPGLNCRVTAGNEKREFWLPIKRLNVSSRDDDEGETVVELPKERIEVGGRKIDLSFCNEFKMLPFKVSLLNFSAPHDEGLENSESFASFESTLAFDDQLDVINLKKDAKILREPGIASSAAEDGSMRLEGAILEDAPGSVNFELAGHAPVRISKSEMVAGLKKTHKISMNYPTIYPVTWYGPWLGSSYKFSQANHKMPMDPDYSGVQVLRDPGWMPKWVGCLMICFGIFTMFYLKPYFNRRQE